MIEGKLSQPYEAELRPSAELRFYRNRLQQRWVGGQTRVLTCRDTVSPRIIHLQQQEWRDVPKMVNP